MIWNVILHIIIGYYGRYIITEPTEGCYWLIGTTIFVQGIGMMNFYRKSIIRIKGTKNEEAKQAMLQHTKTPAFAFKLTQWLIFKVIIYGAITLFVAKITT